MFTGIIEHCSSIQEIQSKDDTLQLSIACPYIDLQLGESIAVNGICLTVSDIRQSLFTCVLSPETLRVTNASLFKPGQPVNLERALRLSDRLGGHMVQGHIDQTGIVTDLHQHQDCLEATIGGVGSAAQAYLIPKGSITINGVSLTINKVLPQAFKLMLIPHTLAVTNLKHLQINDVVNIEFDCLVKTINQQVQYILNHRE